MLDPGPCSCTTDGVGHCPPGAEPSGQPDEGHAGSSPLASTFSTLSPAQNSVVPLAEGLCLERVPGTVALALPLPPALWLMSPLGHFPALYKPLDGVKSTRGS